MKLFADDRVCHEAGNLNPGCPQCQQQTPMTPISRPDFAAISALKPETTALTFLCLKCREPVMVRYAIDDIGETEIKLSPAPPVAASADTKVNLNYLPGRVRKPYSDALGCYQHELIQPFALMCKQTVDAVIRDLGEGGRLRVFNHLEELRDIFDVEPQVFEAIGEVLFENKRSLVSNSVFGKTEAAVLLESMKDMLYQFYVREQRLKKAVSMRRFFAGQAGNDDGPAVKPLQRPA